MYKKTILLAILASGVIFKLYAANDEVGGVKLRVKKAKPEAIYCVNLNTNKVLKVGNIYYSTESFSYNSYQKAYMTKNITPLVEYCNSFNDFSQPGIEQIYVPKIYRRLSGYYNIIGDYDLELNHVIHKNKQITVDKTNTEALIKAFQQRYDNSSNISESKAYSRFLTDIGRSNFVIHGVYFDNGIYKDEVESHFNDKQYRGYQVLLTNRVKSQIKFYPESYLNINFNQAVIRLTKLFENVNSLDSFKAKQLALLVIYHMNQHTINSMINNIIYSLPKPIAFNGVSYLGPEINNVVYDWGFKDNNLDVIINGDARMLNENHPDRPEYNITLPVSIEQKFELGDYVVESNKRPYLKLESVKITIINYNSGDKRSVWVAKCVDDRIKAAINEYLSEYEPSWKRLINIVKRQNAENNLNTSLPLIKDDSGEDSNSDADD